MQFIDIQVNGAFGVDFNDDALCLDSFCQTCDRLRETGVEKLFPTIISAPLDRMLYRVQKIANWVKQSASLQEIVGGIHIEGPFISSLPGYRGTHDLAAIMDASPEVTLRLLEAGRGLVKLVTLAPERDPDFRVISLLAKNGVVVFGGHSDATFEQLQGAIDCGMKGFTHLGNGCALEVNRQDNILQRVLALRSKIAISVIADGIHVPFWLLSSWSEAFDPSSLIVTSDSMSAAGMPPGEYWICGQPILVDTERRTRHRDHAYLAGSASTMLDMSNIASRWLGGDTSRQEKYFLKNAKRLFQL